MEKNTQAEKAELSEDIIAKAKKNKKALVWGIGAAVAVVIIACIWIFVAQAGSKKADELAGKADAEMVDSIAMGLYKEAAEAGYKSGNRARAEVAIRLYNEGKYQEAIDYLDDCKLGDNIAAAGVYALKGDCYVNLEKYNDALNCYENAVSKADKNPEVVPFVLIKEANVYRALKNYKDEAECYETIIEDYPSYVATTRTDVKKYYERALAESKK